MQGLIHAKNKIYNYEMDAEITLWASSQLKPELEPC